MTMEGYRREIGEIDRQLVALFARRMAMSAGIAREKTAMGLPVLDPAREQERLAAVCAQAGPDLAGSTAALYTAVLALSRAAQYACPAGGPGPVRLTLAGPRTQGGLYALLAQMEAMAAGLPCVVSDVRGNNDLIAPGEGGFLRPPRDVRGFTQDIMRLLEDPALRARMGERNRREMRRYSLEAVLCQMTALYRDLLDGREP